MAARGKSISPLLWAVDDSSKIIISVRPDAMPVDFARWKTQRVRTMETEGMAK